MEHFRRYFDAPRAPSGGVVALSDGRALTWTADGFQRTRANGEAAEVVPDDLGVHLSRWRTIVPRLVGESVEHYLNVVVRGAGKPFEFRAEVDDPEVLSGLPWQEVDAELADLDALGDLLAALGMAEVPLASWAPEATREPARAAVRRLTLGTWLGRHNVFARALGLLAVVPALMFLLVCRADDGQVAPIHSTVVDVQPAGKHQQLRIRDESGKTSLIALPADGYEVGDELVSRDGRYARADSPDAPSAPVPRSTRAIVFVLALGLLLGTVRWTDFGLLRRGRIVDARPGSVRNPFVRFVRAEVMYKAHDGVERTVVAWFWGTPPSTLHVAYRPDAPDRAIAVEAPFGRVSVGEKVVAQRVRLLVVLLLLVPAVATGLALFG